MWPSQLPSFPEHVEAASPDLPKVARLFMRFLDFYGFGGKFQPHIHVVQLRLPASHGLALKTDRFYSRYEKKVSIAIEDVIEKDQWAAHINEKRWCVCISSVWAEALLGASLGTFLLPPLKEQRSRAVRHCSD